MNHQKQQDELHKAVESVIVKHGAGKPDLTRELRQIQHQLQELDRRHDYAAWTKKALQLSALIKFIWDNWP